MRALFDSNWMFLLMTISKSDPEFNEILKRLMDEDAKPHEEIGKGREPKPMLKKKQCD